MRWFRLVACLPSGRRWQLSAGPSLAGMTDLFWRFARKGITTEIVHDWLEMPG